MEKMKLARQCLSAQLEPATLDEHRRTIDVQFYSGANVERMDFWTGERFYLAFSTKPEHVRLGRLNSGGAPVLDSHAGFRVGNVLGVIERAWLEGGTGKATLRFSERPDVEPLWMDIKNGIVRNVSMGASIRKLEDVTPKDSKEKHFLAIDWEPMEISAIPIPADAGAQFLQQQTNEQLYNEVEIVPTTRKESIMQINTAINNPDREGIQKAVRLANSNLGANLDEAFCQRLINTGTTLADARTAILEKMAERSEVNPIRTANASITQEPAEGMRDAMVEALTCRYSGAAPTTERGRYYVGARLTDFARDILQANGHRVTSLRPSKLIELAHTTSDFPALLTEFGRRALLEAYRLAEPRIKRVCRRSTAQDFRVKSILRLGEAPRLLEVNEHGEITEGSRAESKQSYRLHTFGRIFSITREAQINDDLGGFNDSVRDFGQAAANLEAELIVDLLTTGGGTGPTLSDSIALFDSLHANVGTPGAFDDDALSEGRTALRTQTGIGGTQIIDASPRFIVVPASLETAAQRLLAPLYPATVGTVNPFAGSGLEIIVDPRLDGKSTSRWYLFSDPGRLPVIEYSYLEGNEGPQFASREGFNILATELRCTLDFGVGALDHRGAWTNTVSE